MEESNEQNIFKADDYETIRSRQSQRKRLLWAKILRLGVGYNLNKVPRTRDGEFAPTVFERYQRNEKALARFKCLSVCFRRFDTVKFPKDVEELCGNRYRNLLFLAWLNSLTRCQGMQNRSLSGTELSLSLMTDGFSYIKVREDHRVLSKSFAILAIRDNRRWWSWIIGFMIQNGRKWWHMVHLPLTT